MILRQTDVNLEAGRRFEVEALRALPQKVTSSSSRKYFGSCQFV